MCIRDRLRAIERRQINLVITKDLSRLGRNYLQTGHLIEDFFPRNGVRYIAMNDGIDTLRDNNDIAPFKNILNEMYSKDISKKVHSSYLLKAQKGQFTGLSLIHILQGRRTGRAVSLWEWKAPTALQAGSSIAFPPLRRHSIKYCGLHIPVGH